MSAHLNDLIERLDHVAVNEQAVLKVVHTRTWVYFNLTLFDQELDLEIVECLKTKLLQSVHKDDCQSSENCQLRDSD